MAHTQTCLRIIVAALSLAILQVTPGVAEGRDPADAALAAYHEAKEKERQVWRTLEEAQKTKEEAEKRLEATTRRNTAIEAALDNSANLMVCRLEPSRENFRRQRRKTRPLRCCIAHTFARQGA